VGSVLIAEFAVLFCFHAVRVVLFFFHRVVVSLLAICAGQGDFCTHVYPSLSFKTRRRVRFCNTKKTPPPDVQVE